MVFMTLRPFENIVEKGENVCFLPNLGHKLLFNPFLYNHGFSRVYLIRTITAFNVSTLSVQSRLFTYLPYSNNHGFSRVPFSTLKNRLFRRCLKSMIYEIIRVKCYLYFGVSKPICLFFGKGSYFKLKKVGVWKYTCVSAEIKL